MLSATHDRDPRLREAAAAFARFAAKGDGAAFALAFDRTAPDLMIVAARLGHRAGPAEDLLQATWLHAIRRAAHYDPTRPLLPWLIGILVREARMRRRTAARAAARVAGDVTNLEPPARSLAPPTSPREELENQLGDALERLDERHRTVLALRLVHGLSAPDIARATGRAPDTVRVQLARGLARLRRLLPAGHALPVAVAFELPDAAGLAGLRAKLLAEVAAGTSAAKAGAAAFTFLTMNKLAWGGVALALAAVALVWSRAAEATSPAGAAAATEPDLADASRAIDPTPVSVATEEPAGDTIRRREVVGAYAGSAVVCGRCVDEVGRPLANVRVAVAAVGAQAPPGGMEVRAPAKAADDLPVQTTGPDGTFAVELPDAGRYQIALTAEGRARREGPAWHDPHALQAGGRFDLGDLVLPAAAPIRGTLVDRDGNPVQIASGWIVAQAALAQLDRWPAQLDSASVRLHDDASFTTDPLVSGPWRVQLVARGWFATPVTLQHISAGSTVSFVVEAVPPLSGLVVDEAGRPLPDMQVSARRRLGQLMLNPMHVKTGGDGTFALASDGGHGPDDTVDVVAYDQLARFGRVTLPMAFGGPEARFVLPRLRSLTVHVVDAASGELLPGALVGWNEALGQPFVARTAPAPAGVAELTGLPPAPVAVAALGPSGEHRIARASATGVVRDGASAQPT